MLEHLDTDKRIELTLPFLRHAAVVHHMHTHTITDASFLSTHRGKLRLLDREREGID